jgi:hypothetical protein
MRSVAGEKFFGADRARYPDVWVSRFHFVEEGSIISQLCLETSLNWLLQASSA